MSAEREPNVGSWALSESSHLAVLVAGGPPAVPVKSLSDQVQVTTKGLLGF
jgi:hypothetical protein